MISQDTLQDVAARLQNAVIDDALVATLRQEFAPLHFTLCSEDDICTPVPATLSHESFALYLIDGREHCLSLTGDKEIATGIVVATIEAE